MRWAGHETAEEEIKNSCRKGFVSLCISRAIEVTNFFSRDNLAFPFYERNISFRITDALIGNRVLFNNVGENIFVFMFCFVVVFLFCFV
jgi:hypothetical protein